LTLERRITPTSIICRRSRQHEFRRCFRGVTAVGLRPPYLSPRKQHTTTATGRGSTYPKPKPVQTKPTSSLQMPTHSGLVHPTCGLTLRPLHAEPARCRGSPADRGIDVSLRDNPAGAARFDPLIGPSCRGNPRLEHRRLRTGLAGHVPLSTSIRRLDGRRAIGRVHWRTANGADRPIWKHWLTIIESERIATRTELLIV
jgi:hypothetical protein